MSLSGVERVLLGRDLRAKGLEVLRLDLHGGEWMEPLTRAGAVLEEHATGTPHRVPWGTGFRDAEEGAREVWAPRWAVILADCLGGNPSRPRLRAFIVRTGRSEERRAALLAAVDLGDLDAGYQLLLGWLRRSPVAFKQWRDLP